MRLAHVEEAAQQRVTAARTGLEGRLVVAVGSIDLRVDLIEIRHVRHTRDELGVPRARDVLNDGLDAVRAAAEAVVWQLRWKV